MASIALASALIPVGTHLEGILVDAVGACGSELLDASCGGGAWSRMLHRHGYRVTGVDRSRWRIARCRASAGGRELDFRVGDPIALPAADGSFDAVLARHLLSRVAQPHRALGEWLRVLRPGGRVLIEESYPKAERRGWLRPPPFPSHRLAPFRAGLPREEAFTFLNLAELWDLRVYDLGATHYLVRGRKP
ncbi:MAG: class I SAM-dependent methyltransferase [Planctomycetota bacterium]|jgi:ubiquinone/menaquinone biosynthesis C-methylase UbiE